MFLSSSFFVLEEHPQLLFKAAFTSSSLPSKDTSAKKNPQQEGATTCCKQPHGGVVEPQGFAGTPRVTAWHLHRTSFLPGAKLTVCNRSKTKQKNATRKGMSPWMKILGKYLPLRRDDAALPYLCNSISVAVTIETAAFPVAVITERQHGG